MNNITKGCIGIIARLGSTRLSDKHLIKVEGKPILTYLIERIKHHFIDEINNYQLEIIILTGGQRRNERLDYIAKTCEISTYFGDNNNIPNRMLEAINKHHFDYIISVDGDDIICSPEGIRKVYDSLASGSDYIKTIGYPFGMNSMGMTKSFLAHSLKNNKNNNLETGWGWIFDEDKCTYVGNNTEQDKRLRFTLDYPEDLSLFKKIISSVNDIYKAKTDEIIDFVIDNKTYLDNMHLNEIYWKNFNYHQAREMKGN